MIPLTATPGRCKFRKTKGAVISGAQDVTRWERATDRRAGYKLQPLAVPVKPNPRDGGWTCLTGRSTDTSGKTWSCFTGGRARRSWAARQAGSPAHREQSRLSKVAASRRRAYSSCGPTDGDDLHRSKLGGGDEMGLVLVCLPSGSEPSR
jgi:hypothetical protein